MAPEPRAEAQSARATTILLVEDDASVRAAVARCLRREGHTVLEAAHAGEALDRWEGAPEVDLLLTDMVMPGALSGVDLAERIRSEAPTLRVIVVSGYPPDATSLSGPNVHFLPKPFAPSVLIETVRAALASPSSA